MAEPYYLEQANADALFEIRARQAREKVQAMEDEMMDALDGLSKKGDAVIADLKELSDRVEEHLG